MTTQLPVLFALALLALAGCAASSPPREPPAPAYDADQLAAAALQTWAVDRDPARALRLAERAAAAAPERSDIAWLHLRLCTQAPACEPQPLEARLKKLAPDNAAVWLSVLDRTQTNGDTQATEQVLAAMSRAEAFNLYWTRLLWRVTSVLRATLPPRNEQEAAAPLTAALDDATGWLSALVLPSFEPLNIACSAQRLSDATRRASCERTAQVLQRGDTYAAEGVGLGIAQRLAARGSHEAGQVERRIGMLSYQNQAAAEVIASQVERDKFAAEMLELMQQLPREQDVSLAILRWAGQPITP